MNMRARQLVAVTAVVVAAFSAAPAGADEVLLKNGFSLKGRVDERGDQLVVHTPNGRVWVAKSQVAKLVERETDGEAFVRRRAALLEAETPDLDARVRLAKWGIARGLHTAGRRELRDVLALDPGHAAARTALGFVRHEGVWVTPDEQKRLLGFVLDDGDWVTPAEAELRRAKRADAVAAANAVAERERIAAETRRLEARARAAEAEARIAEATARSVERREERSPTGLAQDANGRWYRTVVQHSGAHYRQYLHGGRLAARPRRRRSRCRTERDAHTRLRKAAQDPCDPHTRLRTAYKDPHDPHTRLRTQHRADGALLRVSFGAVTLGSR
jgi:hypothetical protein